VSKELALECVRLAIPIVSPTMDDRWEGIAQLSQKMYSHITNLAEGKTPQVDEADTLTMRRQRKPREQLDNKTPLDEDKSRNVAASKGPQTFS